MPRRAIAKSCACGCGKMTKGGDFLPGHDQRLWGALVREVGSAEGVRTIVEKHLKRRIEVEKA